MSITELFTAFAKEFGADNIAAIQAVN